MIKLNNPITTGRKLKQFRSDNNMTQLEMAYTLQIQQNYYSRLENGLLEIKLSLLQLIAIRYPILFKILVSID